MNEKYCIYNYFKREIPFYSKFRKMKLNEDSITYAAYAFAYFLSASLMKYVLYDNGFAFSNVSLYNFNHL